MPVWIKAGVDDYLRRLPREINCTLSELKPDTRTGMAIAQRLATEAARIEAALPAGALRVVLDERGSMLTTLQLAEKFERWMQDGRDVAFVIGSADGLDASLKKKAELQLALSAFTLPHALARVVLVEQLYRVFSLLKNHPYHRE